MGRADKGEKGMTLGAPFLILVRMRSHKRALAVAVSLCVVGGGVLAACSSDSESNPGEDSGQATSDSATSIGDSASTNDASSVDDAQTDSGAYNPAACRAFFASVDPTVQVPSTPNSTSQRALLIDSGGGVRKETGKYVATWAPSAWFTSPNRTLIVDLHGTGGYPEAEFNDFRSYLQQRNWGFLGISYLYNANNDAGDYDTPVPILARINAALDEMRAACGSNITLHLMGFSRGSANTYAIAMLDRQAEGKINGVIANAGAWPPDAGPLPPELLAVNGNPMAMKDTRMWGWCGLNDMTHGYPMCDEMTTALKWVQDHGGTVAPGTPFVSPDAGHTDFKNNPVAVDAGFTWIESLPAR